MNGEYLRLLRKEKGLTQEELALMLGYTDRSTISRIEKDEIHLTQDKIKQYADLCHFAPKMPICATSVTEKSASFGKFRQVIKIAESRINTYFSAIFKE